MSTDFPASLDSGITAPTAQALGASNPTHSDHHQNLDDRVIALEEKVGADSSAVTSSHDYKIAQLLAAGSIDYIQTSDPGAVGAGKTWLRYLRSGDEAVEVVRVRNDDDTAWLPNVDQPTFLIGDATPRGESFNVSFYWGNATSGSFDLQLTRVRDGVSFTVPVQWDDDQAAIQASADAVFGAGVVTVTLNVSGPDQSGTFDFAGGSLANTRLWGEIDTTLTSTLAGTPDLYLYPFYGNIGGGPVVSAIDGSIYMQTGANSLWLRQSGEWNEVRPILSTSTVRIESVDSSTSWAKINAQGYAGDIQLSVYQNGTTESENLDVQPGRMYRSYSDNVNYMNSNWYMGFVDPSAGAGISAAVSSFYTRDVGGANTTGELWFKTGAGDTDWTKIV